MARQVINNGDTGLSARTKINANFLELYDDVAALQAGGGGGGGGAWGSITGTLSAQTDLSNALAAKASLAGPQFTGSWRLSMGTIGTENVRPVLRASGNPGLGFYNYLDSFVGGFSAGNDGAFYLETASGRITLSNIASFQRYVATDSNGGGAFAPLFTLDSTISNEGGFWRSGTDQMWCSGRANRIRVGRDGVIEFLTGSRFRITGIPTSATGLSAGDVWSDAGTLKIVS
jgi:hypothetical protein